MCYNRAKVQTSHLLHKYSSSFESSNYPIRIKNHLYWNILKKNFEIYFKKIISSNSFYEGLPYTEV